ncbi:MAG: GNAT family N-acetyltransferase [Bacteroidota bacterium]|nr:GNAT family N-acetyltransferase [Bacteroidota bacterium]
MNNEPKAELHYREAAATKEVILAHLRECDMLFVPPLSSWIDLPAYGEKLAAHATTFGLWQNECLVAFIAAYMNRPEGGIAFISSVSVVADHQGRGLASLLLDKVKERAGAMGFAKIHLEVDERNFNAIALYERHGFVQHTVEGHRTTMEFNKL